VAVPGLIGLGMDGEEAPDPPEKFAEVFARAGQSGLRLTSHASEDAPPANIVTCLDVLGCERIDHGYYVLDDEATLRRCRDEGIGFTTCVTSTVKAYFTPVLADHPIPAMIEAGLLVTLNSDDPTMVDTDLGEEYVRLCTALAYGTDVVRRLCLNGIEASWLDPVDKTAMRQSFEEELDSLEREMSTSARRDRSAPRQSQRPTDNGGASVDSYMSMDRRSFLKQAARGGAGAVLLGATGTSLLAACGSTSKASTSIPYDRGRVLCPSGRPASSWTGSKTSSSPAAT
jgi:hypothetical protein